MPATLRHVLGLLALAFPLAAPASADLPPDFVREQVVSGLASPTTMAFLSPTELLVGEKDGVLRLVDLSGPTPQTSVFMTLPDVESDWERGLISLVLDPNYATNGFFYLYYQHQSTFRFRVSRFTSMGDHAMPSSELVLWQDNAFSSSCCHFGGGMDIGPDGYLYLTTGEEFDGAQAQDLTQSGGKIHRFGTDGSLPPDNPFLDGAGPNVDTIWAYGLRNPFRAKWDLATSRLFIGEVGGNVQETAREDLHLGMAGLNYGWPSCEGECDNPDFPSCSCAQHEDTLYSYDHSVGQAIVAGFVWSGGEFPGSYDGAFFYGDYAAQWIRYLTFDATGTTVTGSFDFETTAGSVVFLAQGPDGALWYCDLDGTIQRIRYDNGNQAPQILSVSADVTNGLAPLTVEFTGSATDPENDPLDKHWYFGDGNDAPGEVVSHTYTSNGVYEARWSVADQDQTVLSDPLEITVGWKPNPSISSPADGDLFQAGDVISFSGGAVDLDSTIGAEHLSWVVEFLHNSHTHPAYGPITGYSGTFSVPTSGHDFSSTTAYRITLTATDDDGLSNSTSVTVYPDKVDMTVDTAPSGLTVFLDGLPRTTPFVHDTLVGFEHTLRALPSVCLGPDAYGFSQWSDTGAPEHVVVVPPQDLTLTADYVLAGDCALPVETGLVTWLKADFGVSEAAGIVTAWADGSSLGNNLTAVGNPVRVPDALNGHSYLALDGVGDHLERTASVSGLPGGGADRTVFAVVRYHSVGGTSVSYGFPACDQAFALGVSATGAPTVAAYCPASEFEGSAQGVNSGWMVQSALHTTGTFGHYKNGQPIDIRSHAFTTVVDRLVVGATVDGSQHRTMDVAEVLIYDRALSEAERLEVEAYLQAEYFGTPCDSGLDCNANGIDDACELGNPGRSLRLSPGDQLSLPATFLNGDFTLEAWVRLPAPISRDDALVSRNGGGQEVTFKDGLLRLFSQGDVLVATTPMVPDTWTHVALVRSGSDLSIYLDGVLDASTTWSGLFEPELLGRGIQGANTTGWLDEVRLWQVARTEAQLQAAKDLALGLPEPGLVGAWRFDDPLVDQTVRDFSGLGNHLTLGLSTADELEDAVRDEQTAAPLTYVDDVDQSGVPDTCELGSPQCVHKVSAAGCVPTLAYSGTPSLSGADNFYVLAEQVPGQVSGLVLVSPGLLSVPPPPPGLSGTAVAQRPGFPQCLGGARWLGDQQSGGTLGACDGSFALHVPQQSLARLGYQAGDTLLVQVVYDDPGHPDGTGKGHTAALQFTLLP